MSYARRHSTNVCPGNRVRYTVWTPDGRSLAFASDRDGAMQAFLQTADGAQEAVRLGGGEIPKVFVDSETLRSGEWIDSGNTPGHDCAEFKPPEQSPRKPGCLGECRDRVKPIPSWNSPRLLMAYAAFFFDVVVSIFSSRFIASRSLGRCR